MITMTDIRNRTSGTTYNKGKAIYNSNKILEFNVIEEEELDIIEATVKGSGRSKYEVAIEYDVNDGNIGEASCECPAFYSYSGICKHCVAVLMEYKDYQETYERNILSDLDLYDDDDEFMDFGHQILMQLMGDEAPFSQQVKQKKEEKRPTTPIFKNLLTKQVEKRTLPIVEQEIQGQVKIEPILTIGKDFAICLNFKLGMQQMYVLKDTVDFYHKVSDQMYHSYGQKLQFTHHMSAFVEEDRPLVKFICQVVEYSLKQWAQMHYAYYSKPNPKYLELNGEQLEGFIEIMKGRAFQADIYGEEEKIWQVTDEKLPRELTIEGQKDGILVRLAYLNGIRCKTESIYFHKGKVYRSSLKETEPIQDFLRCMAEIPNRCAYIEKKDVPIFCRELLPNLEKFYVCHQEDFNPLDYDVIPAIFEIYLDAPQTDWITCRAEVLYGDKRYNVLDDSNEKLTRDLVSEKVVEQLVMTYATGYDEKEKQIVISDEDKIYDLLMQGIEKMSQLAQVYVSDKLKRLKVKPSPKITVGVSLDGDLMQLSMLSEDLGGQELVDLLSQYKQKKRFYRLKNGDFMHVAEEEMKVLLELKQSLELSDEQLKKGEVQVPKYRALYLDGQLKSQQSLRTTKNKAFKELIRHMKTVEDNDFEVPTSLEGVLREYQKRGFLWIKTLKYNGFGGILADDMGLGKTLQVITFLLSEYQEVKENSKLRTLIVCPASLVFNWKAEIEKFAPELSVKLVTGSTKERKAMIQTADAREILVTSYDLLKRDIECYKDLQFAYQIIDEGQYIKNHNTQAAKAVKMIRADFKLALTGTPIENRLSELWSLFDYLMPGFLYPYTKFKEELEQPIVQGKDEAAIKRLQKMIQPFTLRRLKKEVLTDLPDKIEENQYVILSGEQQKLYDANVEKLRLILDGQTDEDFKKSKLQILSELTKLRQICCDPGLLYENYKGDSAKLDACMELIQNAINGGHKILIFSQFTSMLDTLRQQLECEKIPYYLLTGSTSKEKRIQMVDAFNQDDTPVFCISLKAGGTGLNLTAADIVIHYDPWWNIAVENQATDRAHRIGQQNVVSVYKLIAKGTIEENIIKIQSLKKELADQVLSGEGMSTGSFTKEDLLELLQS